VDLTSYAELAVRLVNTAVAVGNRTTDRLAGAEAFRAFVADDPHLRGPWTHHDLDALRMLRTELAAVFAAAAQRDYPTAVDRINTLLIQHPLRPVLVRHDRSRWHVHLDDSGSVADRYAAAAVCGLATVVAQFGPNHLGICAIPDCQSAFVEANSARPGRYCMKHSAGQADVTALPGLRRPAAS
jgi:hypothetical protein